MKELELQKAFMLIEPGPVTMIATSHKGKYNIMTVTWTMVMDFTPRFALLTGPWNYSCEALLKTKECVIGIATADLVETILDVGTTTGRDVDKFGRFGLTPLPASEVRAPLIKECYANIECRVVDYIKKHNIFVLDGVKAWINKSHKDKRILHARGDGTFIADGEIFKRRKRMGDKLPPGV
ncbi:MAG: flavin reductase family protein [Fibrobacter sp.]|jgi:flavin reductase (DIM6/NTAB) family NADH-FMN oxidoreductase RutF|nr:flavin reductase family protein [Fibrobacter sp.]